jgi:hypothetical protein
MDPEVLTNLHAFSSPEQEVAFSILSVFCLSLPAASARTVGQFQWRLVAKLSGGAAPENCIFFINWGMATDIKLKDYILYKYKERQPS